MENNGKDGIVVYLPYNMDKERVALVQSAFARQTYDDLNKAVGNINDAIRRGDYNFNFKTLWVAAASEKAIDVAFLEGTRFPKPALEYVEGLLKVMGVVKMVATLEQNFGSWEGAKDPAKGRRGLFYRFVSSVPKLPPYVFVGVSLG